MRKAIIASAVLLVFAAILAAIWLLPPKPRAGPWRLADGSGLSLAGVTYGPKHTMRYGYGLADYLYPVLPSALRTRLQCKVASISADGSNDIVLWFWKRRTSAPAGGMTVELPRYSLVAFDAAGNESAKGLMPSVMQPWRGTNELQGWQLPDFPRRSREVGIRIYGVETNGTSEVIGEFKIPNRGPNDYPVWTAMPLPVTVKTNGLEVSLVQLDPRRAVFKASENQQASDGWTVTHVVASSASGQRYECDTAWDAATAVAAFRGPLWLDEPAWKLRARVCRTTNYPAGELWTVKSIAIPGPGQSRRINLRTNIYGSEIQLVGIEGGTLIQNASSRKTYRSPPVLTIRNSLPEAENLDLSLFEVQDNQGRKVDFFNTGYNPSTAYALKVADDAENVDVTLVYTKSLSVEFIAKPVASGMKPESRN